MIDKEVQELLEGIKAATTTELESLIKGRHTHTVLKVSNAILDSLQDQLPFVSMELMRGLGRWIIPSMVELANTLDKNTSPVVQ